jgi:hypothetical protein
MGYEKANEWARAFDPTRGWRVWADRWSRFWLLLEGEDEPLELCSPPCKEPDMVSVAHLGLFGEDLLCVYTEKHYSLAWVGRLTSLLRYPLGDEVQDGRDDGSKAPPVPARLVHLGTAGYRMAVFGDVLAFHDGRAPGIVELRELPTLTPMPPVLTATTWPEVNGDDDHLLIDGCLVAIPPAGQRRLLPRAEVMESVVDTLAKTVELDRGDLQMIVASAVGDAFAPEPPVCQYEEVRSLDRVRLPSLQWLPIYVHERLSAELPEHSDALLRAFDMLAAKSASTPVFSAPVLPGDDGTAATIALATERVYRCAAAWAPVARTRSLPRGVNCRLLFTRPLDGDALLAGQPVGLRDAYLALAAHPPPSLSDRE